MSYCKILTVGACHFDDEVNPSLQTESVLHILTLARLQSNSTYNTSTHDHKPFLQCDVNVFGTMAACVDFRRLYVLVPSYGCTSIILIEPP